MSADQHSAVTITGLLSCVVIVTNSSFGTNTEHIE